MLVLSRSIDHAPFGVPNRPNGSFRKSEPAEPVQATARRLSLRSGWYSPDSADSRGPDTPSEVNRLAFQSKKPNLALSEFAVPFAHRCLSSIGPREQSSPHRIALSEHRRATDDRCFSQPGVAVPDHRTLWQCSAESLDEAVICYRWTLSDSPTLAASQSRLREGKPLRISVSLATVDPAGGNSVVPHSNAFPPCIASDRQETAPSRGKIDWRGPDRESHVSEKESVTERLLSPQPVP